MSQRTAEHEAQLDAFFAGLTPAVEMATKAQKRLDRLAATKFSVFHYFQENENLISGIFADLLRPDGSHGQGATFLKLFLKEIELGKRNEREKASGRDDKHPPKGASIRGLKDYKPLEPCTVWTEYAALVKTKDGKPLRRRIDIVLKFESGNKLLGVENKPWAYEQCDQVQHYLDFLQEDDDRACILYLSGDGSDSKTIKGASVKHYLTVPYGYARKGASVAHWIAQCHAHCRADRVRWFLNELREYIDRMFYAESREEEYDHG